MGRGVVVWRGIIGVEPVRSLMPWRRGANDTRDARAGTGQASGNRAGLDSGLGGVCSFSDVRSLCGLGRLGNIRVSGSLSGVGSVGGLSSLSGVSGVCSVGGLSGRDVGWMRMLSMTRASVRRRGIGMHLGRRQV